MLFWFSARGCWASYLLDCEFDVMKTLVNCQELGSPSDLSIKDRISIKMMIGFILYVSTIMHDKPSAHCKNPLGLDNRRLSCQPDCRFAGSEPLGYRVYARVKKERQKFIIVSRICSILNGRIQKNLTPSHRNNFTIPWQIWAASLCNCIHPLDLLQWDTILQHLMMGWSLLFPCSHQFEQ